MDINRSIVNRIADLVEEFARWRIVVASRLRPRVAASEAIARSEDELTSTNGTDSIDSRLRINN